MLPLGAEVTKKALPEGDYRLESTKTCLSSIFLRYVLSHLWS